MTRSHPATRPPVSFDLSVAQKPVEVWDLEIALNDMSDQIRHVEESDGVVTLRTEDERTLRVRLPPALPRQLAAQGAHFGYLLWGYGGAIRDGAARRKVGVIASDLERRFQ